MSDQRLLLLSLGLGAVIDFLPPPAILGFVPTAGTPYEDPYFVREDRSRLERLGYGLVELDLSAATPKSLKAELARCDGLFVAGGNTFFLLQEIQRQELGDVLTAAIGNGLPYIGASAGAVIVGPTTEPVQALDDVSAAPELRDWSGLGLVTFVVLPHFGKEKYLPLYEQIEAEYGDRLDLRPLRDDQAFLVQGATQPTLIHSELVLHDSK